MSDLGVIFDFDGVIVDSEELWYRSYSVVLGEFGVAVDRETYGREWVGKGGGARYAVEEFGLPITAEEVIARQRPILARMMREDVSLMPGAADAVARVGAAFRTAVATNSPAENVLPVLERFGLREHLDEVVSRERYERAKPAPDSFLAAVAALDLPAKRCLVVEDSEKGVVAAAAAGVPCVAVPNDFTRKHDFGTARRVLGGLDELTPELVREIIGG